MPGSFSRRFGWRSHGGRLTRGGDKQPPLGLLSVYGWNYSRPLPMERETERFTGDRNRLSSWLIHPGERL